MNTSNTMPPEPTKAPKHYLIEQLKGNQHWFFGLGIGLIVIGILAVIFSTASTLISVVTLGFLLVIAGVAEAAKAFNMHRWHGYFWGHVVWGLLLIIAGVIIVANPVNNAILLTLMWAVIFMISGVVRIFTAFYNHAPHKGWMIFNGLVSILLGALVLWQWPVSGLWVIGLFVGVDLMVSGWSLLMISSLAKKA